MHSYVFYEMVGGVHEPAGNRQDPTAGGRRVRFNYQDQCSLRHKGARVLRPLQSKLGIVETLRKQLSKQPRNFKTAGFPRHVLNSL